ncbi:MAG: FAD-dependent oxidoreductase, partial [Wenzhouxiangellaceae bacterium]
MSVDTVVIGAGWAGLSAATVLDAAGHNVVVIEKARGPGGRSATRRTSHARFDLGAQYFTVRNAAFGRQVQQWRDLGLVQPWKPRLAVFGDRPVSSGSEEVLRFVGVPGMSSI